LTKYNKKLEKPKVYLLTWHWLMVIFNIREKTLAVLCLLTPENYLQVLTSCLPPTL